MASAQTSAPPSDAVEATEYSITDKVYFFLCGMHCRLGQTLCWLADTECITGKWRKGEIKDYEGSSDESPRYLVSGFRRAARPELMQKGKHRFRMKLRATYARWRLVT